MKRKHIEMYAKMASVAAEASYAKRLKVGAIAVKEHRILSVGYNGTPPGMDNDCEEVVTPTLPYLQGDGPTLKTKKEVIHAEMNLIYKMARDGQSGTGADLFITHAPCFECAKAILSVGFKKVWFTEHYRDPAGVRLLSTYGVEVEKV